MTTPALAIRSVLLAVCVALAACTSVPAAPDGAYVELALEVMVESARQAEAAEPGRADRAASAVAVWRAETPAGAKD